MGDVIQMYPHLDIFVFAKEIHMEREEGETNRDFIHRIIEKRIELGLLLGPDEKERP